MSDIKLFRLISGRATELQGNASDLEKPLQSLIEANLETLLGIRFLATEYSTGKTHAGRIDSLGLDENNCPAILEYKRSVGENVINQGLFYLDWLMDHQAEFKLLVMDKFGNPAADAIDWTAPRLVCIAADFTKYDGHAVQQINRNIELIRYRRFGDELLLLELANATSASTGRSGAANAAKSPKPLPAEPVPNKAAGGDRSYADWLPLLPPHRWRCHFSCNHHLATTRPAAKAQTTHSAGRQMRHAHIRRNLTYSGECGHTLTLFHQRWWNTSTTTER